MTKEVQKAIDFIHAYMHPTSDSEYEQRKRKYRDMAIKALEQNESAEEWYKLFVEKLEQSSQPSSWISVNSDIKPKEGQEVLTIYEGYYKGQYSKDRARCYYANGGIAFKSLESMAWKYSISRIRAWMPIPEYEEGE